MLSTAETSLLVEFAKSHYWHPVCCSILAPERVSSHGWISLSSNFINFSGFKSTQIRILPILLGDHDHSGMPLVWFVNRLDHTNRFHPVQFLFDAFSEQQGDTSWCADAVGNCAGLQVDVKWISKFSQTFKKGGGYPDVVCCVIRVSHISWAASSSAVIAGNPSRFVFRFLTTNTLCACLCIEIYP